MKKLISVLFLGLILGPIKAVAHEFVWDNLVLAAMKVQPDLDYEGYVDSYMQVFRPEVWHRYKNDEFELQDKRDETVEIMRNKISSFSLDEEFVIHTAFKFGDYDFEKQVFPLDALYPETYFFDSDVRRAAGAFSHEYKVFFRNPGKVDFISMSKEDARAFVKSRKHQNGYVNREVAATLKFRIVGLTGRNELEAELTEVIVYRDAQRTTPLQRY